MFIFEKIPLPTIFMGLFIIAMLILVNEVTRRSKYSAIAMYILIPIVLTIVVWPKTAGAGSTSGYWFAWVKTYSALAGVIGFVALRYIKGLNKNKYMLMFPPFILAVNILEAVYRDIECFSKNGVENGLLMIGGPWNIMNAIAGIISIITITGWCGIQVANTKSKDMIWPDQLWFWIIAYDLWNFAYTYNCISDRSFYAGFTLLISCTVAAFFIKKGAWLQHRAQTLALWGMFSLTFPSFADHSMFAVKSSHNTNALMLVSVIALAANLGVLVYQIIRMVKYKRNPIKEEVYSGLKSFNQILSENNINDITVAK